MKKRDEETTVTIIPALPGFYRLSLGWDSDIALEPEVRREDIVAWRIVTMPNLNGVGPSRLWAPVPICLEVIINENDTILRPDGRVLEIEGDGVDYQSIDAWVNAKKRVKTTRSPP